jgi:predicted N-formylglutamate amidohydrolase
MQPTVTALPALLGPGDPPPVMLRPGRADLVLSVEHAGRAVPRSLGSLGLAAGEIDRHIGWDPGAADLAQAMAELIGARVVAQPYSRLVIDCNRPRGAPDLCPAVSDGTAIPANRGLAADAIDRRWQAIHAPFHAALGAACAAPACRGLVAVHSYDPQRRADAAPRPWPVGLLWRQDNPLAEGLARALAGEAAARPLGVNAPYAIEDASDYSIPVHAEPRRLPHVLIEVRNDLLRGRDAVLAMARLLGGALQTAGVLR